MMENKMTTMTDEPVVAHPMTSYKDVIRTCSCHPDFMLYQTFDGLSFDSGRAGHFVPFV